MSAAIGIILCYHDKCAIYLCPLTSRKAAEERPSAKAEWVHHDVVCLDSL